MSGNLENLAQPRRRQSDQSGMLARQAIGHTLDQFSHWRSELASFAARVERRFNGTERETMLQRCASIEAEVLEARTDLLLELAEAPQNVRGHSRVTDVERALDGIETTLRDIQRKLG
jgi:hypothetical protein